MADRKLIAAAALAALSLAACNDTTRTAGAGGGGGNRLCTPFAGAANANAPGAAAVAPPADPSAAMDDCLHRWGYALAASPDPAEAVAQATLAACASSLSRWNQQALVPGLGGPSPAQAPSLVTGQDTTPAAERYGFASRRALFYVVQARAGKCPAPPMTNGTPDGLTARY